ncbi:TIGR04255 family protein [Thermogemmata fonticola]|uniref:TIGR04255 family protein n=1 Tax=Thermogemmata fonticola TaxID=2755323 RepID=A0A7V8VEP0_9BACT|nr:TIGR04255 family protein [Thermogemmata fonticola]MBA2226665.1 TIGR04255 family protein [Thermogemmata fonticola]
MTGMAEIPSLPPIPRRLRREPLIEAIWQAVFEKLPVPGDFLAGILYAELCQGRQDWQSQRLPTADIPAAVAEQNPHLRYAAKYRIEVPGEPVLYQVGDRIVSVHCLRPYIGWSAFREKIGRVQEALAKTGSIPGPARHILRYPDFVPLKEMPDLSGLQVQLAIGQQVIRGEPLELRVELAYQGHVHTLRVVTQARVRLGEGTDKQEGTVVDLETRADCSQDWSRIAEQLDGMHQASKALFFQQLFQPEMIARWEPEY